MPSPRPLPSQRVTYLIRVCETGTRWTSAANRFWLPRPNSQVPTVGRLDRLHTEIVTTPLAEYKTPSRRDLCGTVLWVVSPPQLGKLAQHVSSTSMTANGRILQLLAVDDVRVDAVLELAELGTLATIGNPEDMPRFRQLIDRHRARIGTYGK
ncbi:hypothetical protein [Stieleria varia]|uniref:Uncharacterized protein n=1 Tax=Stieleria varia TaxID=2528005 RepID=A0A5C6ANE2_9BACT|nr:hypothetical protein [Stieleria varia]TWU01190.1 hypothetical protein Pla52n_45620 [Stieleria varia]